MRTSVPSVGGLFSNGSRWRKPVIGLPLSQSGSSRVPSSFGAWSTGTASATSASDWGTEGNSAKRGRAAPQHREDNADARYAPQAKRCKFFTCPCAHHAEPISLFKSRQHLSDFTGPGAYRPQDRASGLFQVAENQHVS